MALARGSAPWIVVPLLLAVFLAVVDMRLAAPPALVALLFAFFFRDPERPVAEGIVSAADGRLQAMEEDRAVTFLNLHNVHVVRAPYAGTVTALERLPGGHLPAWSARAKRNAGLSITFDTAWGELKTRLIAGLLARRAYSYVQPGERVEKGQRIGIIRLGSRVDVQLPPGATVIARTGAAIRAGETLARPEAPRATGDEHP